MWISAMGETVNKLKKIIIILTAIIFMIAFAACGSGNKSGNQIPGDNTGDPENPGNAEPESSGPKHPDITPSGSIVVVGDSLLDFWDNAEDFLGDFYSSAENVAVLATHTYDWWDESRGNYAKILANDPDEVLIGLGINDIKAGNFKWSPNKTQVYKQIIEKLLEQKPELIIHMISVPKSPAAKPWVSVIEGWNADMKAYCDERKNMHFIDDQDTFLIKDSADYNLEMFVEDKLHFSEAGYNVLEGILDEYFYGYKSNK